MVFISLVQAPRYFLSAKQQMHKHSDNIYTKQPVFDKTCRRANIKHSGPDSCMFFYWRKKISKVCAAITKKFVWNSNFRGWLVHVRAVTDGLYFWCQRRKTPCEMFLNQLEYNTFSSQSTEESFQQIRNCFGHISDISKIACCGFKFFQLIFQIYFRNTDLYFFILLNYLDIRELKDPLTGSC